MIVTDLTGQTEMLIDYSNVAVRQKINEDYTLSFTVVPTEKNAHSYPLVQEESLIECENELFVIKQCADNPYSKSVTALHEFFETIDDFVEEVLLDGIYTIEEALTVAFSSTNDWTYVVEETFPKAQLIEFGGDNLVALLQVILESYGAEYTVSSTDKKVRIKKQLGIETDYQVRYKHNLVAISRQTDSSNVKTAVNVYYNPDEFGEYRNSVVYYSPYKDNYRRIKWAEPIYLDTVTTEADALAYAATQLQDTAIVSITTEFTHLQEAGYNSDDMSLGNSFFLIDERLNLSDTARIVEIERYPFDKSKSPHVTVANKRKIITDVAISQKQRHDQLNNVAVKQKKIYNGCTITKEEGFKATAANGVTVWLNATEGIRIEQNNIQKFYVDTDGNVNFDGRLFITSNDGNTTMLEAFLNDYGGVLNIYDSSGQANVYLGSEFSGGDNVGGTMVLYEDGFDKKRVEAFIIRDTSSGAINLLDGNNKIRMSVYGLYNDSSNNQSPYLILWDDFGNAATRLNLTEGYINNYRIITSDQLTTILNDLQNDIEDFVYDVMDDHEWNYHGSNE